MRQSLSDNTADTVQILRPPPKVFTDERGKTVWMSGIAPCELEIEDNARLGTDPYNLGLGSASL